MRGNSSDDEIVALFRKAFSEKAKEGFEAKKASVSAQQVNVKDIGRVSMTQIGG